MADFYFYKLVVDNGGAPCVHGGTLSLAICKPMIRKSAEVGSWIFGFAGDALHKDNRLIYVAQVAERIEEGRYFKQSKYAVRPDCIYQWKGDKFDVRPEAQFHGSDEDLRHDLGRPREYVRANVLLSRKFRYFGKDGTDGYKKWATIKDAVEKLGQGHRRFHPTRLRADLDLLRREVFARPQPPLPQQTIDPKQCAWARDNSRCGRVREPKGGCGAC